MERIDKIHTGTQRAGPQKANNWLKNPQMRGKNSSIEGRYI